MAGRMGHLKELETIPSRTFRARPGAQWLERLEAAGAPVYGEHTRAVLAEHGYDAAEIEALIAEGAVVAA